MAGKTGTIKSIALEAGCSASTVSRVLAGRTEGFSVRPELAARIKRAAKSFDYRPNPFVRALRAKRTKLIAVMNFPYRSTEVIRGAVKCVELIRAAGYSEVVRYVDHRNPRDFDLEFPVDGAILIDVFDKSCLEGVEKAGIPYVVINGACRERGLSIRVDERVGMELLLDHLTGLGHERIAYANRNDSNALWRHPSILERETHYLEGMRRRGLSPLPNHWSADIPADLFLKEALAAGASAVICYHHLRVFEMLHAAWRMGLAIPKDLSLVCFNDDLITRLSTPPVTCVALPNMEMYGRAAERLLSALAGDLALDGSSLTFPGELIVRESSAAPRPAEKLSKNAILA